jgi:glycosyltransferase involved in cell wall biosynthesis
MSLDPWGAYRRFIQSSRGEFTVAKDQNVRLRSGWFSERAVCYLASGKPVVTQDTGFSSVLPTGEGLFAVADVEQAAEAVQEINADYRRHCEAARAIAAEHFEARAVAARLLADVGLA